MGDKDVRQTKAVFQFPQQVHDLYLRMRIQRGDRFIKQNDLRLAGHRTGDADTLQLSAGKLMGKPVSKIGRQTDQLQQTARFCFPIQFSPSLRSCTVSPSPIISRMRNRGFAEVV